MRTAAALAAACFALLAARAEAGLSASQHLTVEQITSIFENGTTDFRYDYIEDINDNAGVTCGRVGFTSGELLLMTERYVRAKGPDTPLAAYLPCLRRMGDDISRDYSCLFPSVPASALATQEFKQEGGLISRADFGKAWTEAGADPVMRRLQDEYVEETYYAPALKAAREAGLRTPLGVAFVYDATIQMDAAALLKAVAALFAESHGGRSKPDGAAEETEWMRIYVPERKRELSVTEIGASTTSRVDALGQILESGDLQLSLPIAFTYAGSPFRIPG